MKIGSLKNNPNFKMRINQNSELRQLKDYLYENRGYSSKKIDGIMNSISNMADDSYEFKVNSSASYPYEGYICYSITTDNPNAVIKDCGDVCSTMRFFMLRSIKRIANEMQKYNNTKQN